MYRTNWGIGHSMKEILEAHKGPFTGEGHKGLYEILTTSWHAQLAINLAMMGSLSIIVAHHMYAMPPYPYIATDYATQLSLFTHHMWIGGFCVVGGAAHGAIFMVRDYTPANNYNNLLDRVLRHRDAIISHLNWVCIFLGCHAFGFYMLSRISPCEFDIHFEFHKPLPKIPARSMLTSNWEWLMKLKMNIKLARGNPTQHVESKSVTS
jgi:photosystem I P700 chlorophyll a apoprotein A1